MTFKIFYNQIKNHFNIYIKILQTDDAKEYMQSSLTIFCQAYGIIRQTIYPYTSQQNSIPEHKRRHLLDVARTMIFHMNVLKFY